MSYAIMLGSDMFLGTDGVLTVEEDGKRREFFRVRELHRVRSTGEYVVIDCDIIDAQGKREVKLAKNRPVVVGPGATARYTHDWTEVVRDDGSIVIRIEEVKPDDPSLPTEGPVAVALAAIFPSRPDVPFWHEEMKTQIQDAAKKVDAILRITGEFRAGPHLVSIDNDAVRIGSNVVSGSLSMDSGGIHLTSAGFSFG